MHPSDAGYAGSSSSPLPGPTAVIVAVADPPFAPDGAFSGARGPGLLPLLRCLVALGGALLALRLTRLAGGLGLLLLLGRGGIPFGLRLLDLAAELVHEVGAPPAAPSSSEAAPGFRARSSSFSNDTSAL